MVEACVAPRAPAFCGIQVGVETSLDWRSAGSRLQAATPRAVSGKVASNLPETDLEGEVLEAAFWHQQVIAARLVLRLRVA